MIVRGSGLRRLAYSGANGPRWLLEYSPSFFGAAFACLLPRERARIRESLRLVRGKRPSAEEYRDVVRTFVEYAHCFAESLAVERPEARSAAPIVHGNEHLDRALLEGRGAIVVTAHTGAWDAAARWLSRDRACDVMLVMAAERDARARALQDALRERAGVRVVHVGGHALDALPALRHARNGGIVAFQIDRVSNLESALDVELCGRPFVVPAGPFHLARLSGAPVVPVFTRRLGFFRYEISVCEPIPVPPGRHSDGVTRAAARATEAMGRFLSENPTQWFHFVDSARPSTAPVG